MSDLVLDFTGYVYEEVRIPKYIHMLCRSHGKKIINTFLSVPVVGVKSYITSSPTQLHYCSGAYATLALAFISVSLFLSSSLSLSLPMPPAPDGLLPPRLAAATSTSLQVAWLSPLRLSAPGTLHYQLQMKDPATQHVLQWVSIQHPHTLMSRKHVHTFTSCTCRSPSLWGDLA